MSGSILTSGTDSKIRWIIKFYPRTQQGVANENPRALAWLWKFHLCANYDYVFVGAGKLLSAPKTPSHSICCQSSHQVPNSREENELHENELALWISMSLVMQKDTLKLVLKMPKPWDLYIDPSYWTKRDTAFPTRGFQQQVSKQLSFVLHTPNDGERELRILWGLSLHKGQTYKNERSDLHVWPKTHKPASILQMCWAERMSGVIGRTPDWH